MTERIEIPFEGDGAGAAGLSWGQRNIWIPIRRHHRSLPIGGVCPLPAGVTTGDVASELQLLVSRHQALRTRVEFDPAADRHARQVLSPSGQIPLAIVDSATAGHDPAQAAEAVSRHYAQKEFDYPNEWPVRWAVITHESVPTHLVSMICHLSIDGFGVVAMLTELLRNGEDKIGLAAGLAAQSSARPAQPAQNGERTLEPLEQARWQSSPAGQRVSDRALRHWERLMSSVPARRFRNGADPRRPRHWLGRLSSPAAFLATQSIAGRLRLGSAAVLFAAYAVAFARVTGSNPVLTQLLLSNRFRPGLSGTVSPVAQPGLVVLDVADTTFDETVADAWRATVNSSMHAYYDPYRQQALIDAMGERRGEPMEVRCFFNDRRLQVEPEQTGPPPSRGQVAEALNRTTFGWLEPTDQSDEPFMASIENVPGTIACTVNFDTHYLAPARAEAFLHEMEAILLRAAFDSAAPTRVASS